jgi:hypothetical protein
MPTGAVSSYAPQRGGLARHRRYEASQNRALPAKHCCDRARPAGHVAISDNEPVDGPPPEQVRHLGEQTMDEVMGGISHGNGPGSSPSVGVEPRRNLVVD